MRTARVPFVVGLLAAGTLLAGCGGGEPTASIPAANPPAPAPSSTQAPASEPTGEAGSGGDSTGGGSGRGDSGGGAEQAAGRCTDGDLTAALGRTTGEAGQRHTTVVWTNSSSEACTMTGFGGVDLRGPQDPMGTTYSLPRSSKQAAPVRLAPGGTAHTLITWLPPQDGPGWTPTSIAITAPDETASKTVGWPGGAVLRQDAATHPGTYIDPVAAGSEG